MNDNDYKILKDVLNVIGQLLIKTIRKNLKEGKKNASYRLSNTIYYNLNRSFDTIELEIVGVDYAKDVLKGQKPRQSRPAPKKIVQWMKDKNIARQWLSVGGNFNHNNPKFQSTLEFFGKRISDKIYDKGIPAFNFLKPNYANFYGEQILLKLDPQYLKMITDAFQKETNIQLSDVIMTELEEMTKDSFFGKKNVI